MTITWENTFKSLNLCYKCLEFDLTNCYDNLQLWTISAYKHHIKILADNRNYYKSLKLWQEYSQVKVVGPEVIRSIDKIIIGKTTIAIDYLLEDLHRTTLVMTRELGFCVSSEWPSLVIV